MTRVMLVAGAGGVGKTTVSAALAVTAARSGTRTLVLTVDPAKRLADALGLEELGNVPVATPGCDGLSAAMVDARASWEAIIRRHADPDTVDRLLSSRFFKAVAERFPAGQAYAAAEEMAGHIESGRFDLIVVDTPPSSGGIDFFSAPGRMRTLIGGRILRWLTGPRIPARRRLFAMTARPVLKVADTILGGPLLEDVAEFLLDLRTAYDGVAARAKQVERHFRKAVTVVVTTADPTPVRETMRFFRELPDTVDRPRAIVFNRALPAHWAEVGGTGTGLAATNFARWAAEARRQEDVCDEVAARHGVPPALIPWMIEAPTTVEDLAGLILEARGLDVEALLG